MSLDLDKDSSPPITSVDDLVARLRRSERPRADWKVGMEHELIGMVDGGPVPYEGLRSIRGVLERFGRFGYEPYAEEGKVIAARRPDMTLTLEPGGQFELAGRPFGCAHASREEILHHTAQIKAVGQELGIRWLGVGYRPFGTPAEMPWMPKTRYDVMRAYLPTRGKRAVDMMLMTATVQANYDFSSEEDMVRKMRAGMSVSPLVSAMYANSFLVNGKDSGYATFRYDVWNEVDPDRCGLLPFVFEEDFGYRRWVEYALDVPMFFVRRKGRYLPASHLTFRRYMKEGLEEHRATIGDFEDHLTTLFPELRLKSVIEVRGADVGSTELNAALPALWKGIFYDDGALDAADRLLAGMAFSERMQLQRDVARHGLRASCSKGHVLDLARELYAIASEGLKNQACPHLDESDERAELRALEPILESGRAPVDVWRERWHGDLGQDPAKLIAAMAY
ncbi:glutamate--cysteine ligase [Vulgatibacter incomptus]|uniref:Glutamate--cysteine ligase n=1 Tax=Vulgatibacter incomptus TaxID=1391653 RepID=A0A0K1P9M8_9BACT|nr:glutamate-cysteine ligase family protein [Vulgatibacter incomptus]AKU90202.1 Glutamate--cysteine ligase [Vulgatibacter incomptus]